MTQKAHKCTFAKVFVYKCIRKDLDATKYITDLTGFFKLSFS